MDAKQIIEPEITPPKVVKKEWITPERVLIFGAILILICPFLFTRNSFLCFSFDDSTGVIGDTIGGITAPITGLIGAYLVYKALKAQIEANKIISDQFSFQHTKENILQRVLFIREDFDRFKIFEAEYVTAPDQLSAKNHTSFEGIEAIMRTFKIDIEQKSANAVFDPVQAMRMEIITRILINFHSLVIEVIENDLHPSEKKHILELFSSIFYTRIEPIFKNFVGGPIDERVSMWYILIQRMAWSNFTKAIRSNADLETN